MQNNISEENLINNYLSTSELFENNLDIICNFLLNA